MALGCHWRDPHFGTSTYRSLQNHTFFFALKTEARSVNTFWLQGILPVSVILWSGGTETTWLSRIFKAPRFGDVACARVTSGGVLRARPFIPRDSRRPLYIHFCSFLTVTAGGLRKGSPSCPSSLPRLPEERRGSSELGGRRPEGAAARELPPLQPSIPPPRGGGSSGSPRAPHLIQLSLRHRCKEGGLAPTRRLSRLLLQDSRIRGVRGRPPPDSLGGDRGGDTCCQGQSPPPRSQSRGLARRAAAPQG